MNNKTIFYSLLITIFSMHGMEQAQIVPHYTDLVFSDHNLVSHINQQLYGEHGWDAYSTKKDIKTLCLTNKSLLAYYTEQETPEKFIRQFAIKNRTCDACIAFLCKFTNRKNTINKLFNIAEANNASFSADDLKNIWYLNSTQCVSGTKLSRTLLCAAAMDLKLKRVKALINAGIDCNNPRSINPIAYMTKLSYPLLSEKERRRFYAIVRLLLAQNVDPDSRIVDTQPTLLHQAVSNNNRKFARTLLKKGANPYATFIDPKIAGFIALGQILFGTEIIESTIYDIPQLHPNAFDLDKSPEKWLQKLVDKLNQRNLSQNKKLNEK